MHKRIRSYVSLLKQCLARFTLQLCSLPTIMIFTRWMNSVTLLASCRCSSLLTALWAAPTYITPIHNNFNESKGIGHSTSFTLTIRSAWGRVEINVATSWRSRHGRCSQPSLLWDCIAQLWPWVVPTSAEPLSYCITERRTTTMSLTVDCVKYSSIPIFMC